MTPMPSPTPVVIPTGGGGVVFTQANAAGNAAATANGVAGAGLAQAASTATAANNGVASGVASAFAG